MTNITIPREALEAAAKTLKDHPLVPFTEDAALVLARAACLTMLRAWPGMELDDRWTPPPYIHLPLAQEKTDDN